MQEEARKESQEIKQIKEVEKEEKNKVKQAVRYAYLIHSVDSYELACTISKEAVKQEKTVSS